MFDEELLLEKPNLKYKNQHQEIIKEFFDAEEIIIPRAIRIKPNENYKNFLQRTNEREKWINLPEQRVPSSLYFIINKNNKIVWAINIRHILNKNLEKLWGHIWYGIRPSERNKWYATTALKLWLEICKKIWISQAILTCNKENILSAKVIQKNWWILESEYPCQENDNIMTQRRIINI